eukprot:g10699.t1
MAREIISTPPRGPGRSVVVYPPVSPPSVFHARSRRAEGEVLSVEKLKLERAESDDRDHDDPQDHVVEVDDLDPSCPSPSPNPCPKTKWTSVGSGWTASHSCSYFSNFPESDEDDEDDDNHEFAGRLPKTVRRSSGVVFVEKRDGIKGWRKEYRHFHTPKRGELRRRFSVTGAVAPHGGDAVEGCCVGTGSSCSSSSPSRGPACPREDIGVGRATAARGCARVSVSVEDDHGRRRGGEGGPQLLARQKGDHRVNLLLDRGETAQDLDKLMIGRETPDQQAAPTASSSSASAASFIGNQTHSDAMSKGSKATRVPGSVGHQSCGRRHAPRRPGGNISSSPVRRYPPNTEDGEAMLPQPDQESDDEERSDENSNSADTDHDSSCSARSNDTASWRNVISAKDIDFLAAADRTGTNFLGHGASGHVLKAVHRPTNTPVAVKIVNARENSEQLMNDLSIFLDMADVQSPFLVRMLAAYLDDGSLFSTGPRKNFVPRKRTEEKVHIVLEYMDLGSLADF